MNIFRVYENKGRVFQLAREETEPELDEQPISGNVSPGFGQYKVENFNISESEIKMGEQIAVQARISGENIAYIYFDMLLKDPEQEQYYGPVARVSVKSVHDGEVDGKVYPLWEENNLVDLSINPGLRLVTDGINSVLAFTQPAVYGLEGDYLDGLLIRKKTATKLKARLYFAPNGELSKMVVIKNRKGLLIPHTLKLAEGDQFHPYIRVYGINESDGIMRKIGSCYSTQITYQGNPVKLVLETPLPGEYYLGFEIEDMEGHSNRFGQMIKLQV
jgi:hypothetical protein